MDKLHEESRKQFEEAYSKAKHFIHNEDWAWRFWQASRASIVVELPESVQGVSDPFDDGHRVAIDGCADSLRSIGLSIKGE